MTEDSAPRERTFNLSRHPRTASREPYRPVKAHAIATIDASSKRDNHQRRSSSPGGCARDRAAPQAFLAAPASRVFGRGDSARLAQGDVAYATTAGTDDPRLDLDTDTNGHRPDVALARGRFCHLRPFTEADARLLAAALDEEQLVASECSEGVRHVDLARAT